MKWWGYLHIDGSVKVLPYHDPRDLADAQSSDLVAFVVNPFEAENSDIAWRVAAVTAKLNVTKGKNGRPTRKGAIGEIAQTWGEHKAHGELMLSIRYWIYGDYGWMPADDGLDFDPKDMPRLAAVSKQFVADDGRIRFPSMRAMIDDE